jgi:hypothetical protein
MDIVGEEEKYPSLGRMTNVYKSPSCTKSRPVIRLKHVSRERVERTHVIVGKYHTLWIEKVGFAGKLGLPVL